MTEIKRLFQRKTLFQMSFFSDWAQSCTQGFSFREEPRAQLFEGRIALNPGLNLTQVSLYFVQTFSLTFIEHPKFALTLGYLNPALNNPALKSRLD